MNKSLTLLLIPFLFCGCAAFKEYLISGNVKTSERSFLGVPPAPQEPAGPEEAKGPKWEREKGRVILTLNFPVANYFIHSPRQGYHNRSYGGFLGYGVGFNYQYNDRHSVDISFATTINHPIPIPIATNETELPRKNIANDMNIYLGNTTYFNRISLGYGMTGVRYKWKKRWEVEKDPDDGETAEDVFESVRNKYWAVGRQFNAHYHFSPTFSLGFVYRPTFYRPGKNVHWRYEQMISLDLKVNINLGKIGGRNPR